MYIHSANIGTIEKVRGIIHPTLPESFDVKTFFSLVSLGNKKKTNLHFICYIQMSNDGPYTPLLIILIRWKKVHKADRALC